MVSMATVIAYDDLGPILEKLGVTDSQKLREHLACLCAYHSCRDGSTARAYAYVDLMRSFGVDVFRLPVSFFIKHPIIAFRHWRNTAKQAT